MRNRNDDSCWYALKVFYNKVFDIEKILIEDGIESFIPTENVKTKNDENNLIKRKTIISSLIFFKSSKNYAENLQKDLSGKVILYTNKEYIKTNYNQTIVKKTPASISDKEMKTFMIVASSGEEGIEYFAKEDIRYKEGQKVRVTGGVFKGAEGYITRIKHNKRLIVKLTGVCIVATPYIPPCFLENIN